MDHTDEVLTDVKLDGVSIPVPLFLDSGWEWPAKGVWECQFLAFPTKKAITQTHYDALLAEVWYIGILGE